MTSEFKKFAAELRVGAPQLDLHGRDPHEIAIQIDQFLYRNYNKKEPSVEIVYGIGKGVLSKTAREILATHPLVEKVVDKGGFCVVILME